MHGSKYKSFYLRRKFKLPKSELPSSSLLSLPGSVRAKLRSNSYTAKSVPEIRIEACTNPQLQQDLERYYQIHDASSRILAIAQNRLQRLEAAKTLLVSHAQLLVCLKLIQREKVKDALNVANPLSLVPTAEVPILTGALLSTSNHIEPGLVQLCLSKIRIPLIWTDSPSGTNMILAMEQIFPSNVHPTSDNQHRHHHYQDKAEHTDQCEGYSLFCTIQVANVIRETRLIFDIRPGTADIEFDDKWIFDDVDKDFECTIEVYAFPKPQSKNTSVFSRLKLNSSHDLTKKVLEQTDSINMNNQMNSSYFDLVGRCVLKLDDLSTKIHSYALDTGHKIELPSSLANGDGPPAALCDIPLFGTISMRMVAQPYSLSKLLKSGFLWIRHVYIERSFRYKGTVGETPIRDFHSCKFGLLLSRYQAIEVDCCICRKNMENNEEVISLPTKMNKLTPSPVQECARFYRCDLGNRRLSAWLNDFKQTDAKLNNDRNGDREMFKTQLLTISDRSSASDKSLDDLTEPLQKYTKKTPRSDHFCTSRTNSSMNLYKKTSNQLNRSGLSASSINLSLNHHPEDDCDVSQLPNGSSSSNSNLTPDLIIAINLKTHFLDSEPVQRQMDLIRDDATAPSTTYYSKSFHNASLKNASSLLSLSSPASQLQMDTSTLNGVRVDCQSHKRRFWSFEDLHTTVDSGRKVDTTVEQCEKRTLYTFRIASCRCADMSNGSMDGDNYGMESTDVYELGCLDHTDWMAAIKGHIEEQETWGHESFSSNTVVPTRNKKPSSLTSHSSRRSMAFMNGF